jgi:hypothetical protein
MGSNHMHDLFRGIFSKKKKIDIKEHEIEINLSGNTSPINKNDKQSK